MTVFKTNLYTYGHLWAQEMEVSVWAFNQLAGQGDLAPLSERGKNVWVLPDWNDLGKGITRALTKMTGQLGFYPRPVYITERIPLGQGAPYQLQSLKTRYGYIQAIGQRALTALDSGASVAYTDEDGDSVLDTGTVTVVMGSAPPSASEIQMFFTVADIALPSAAVGDERYQIEPATVQVDTGTNTITITAHIAYFVRPPLWRQAYAAPNYNPHNKNVLDTTDAANYVTEVDVYRVYPDDTNAVTLRRRKRSCTSCEWEWDTAAEVADIENSLLGLINLSEASCGCWRGGWAYVDVSYFAGYPIPNYSGTSQDILYTGEPEPALTEALVRLANCEQPRNPNTFSNDIATRWQTDNEYQKFQGEPMDKTPLGSKIGQRAAWDIVSDYALGVGSAL